MPTDTTPSPAPSPSPATLPAPSLDDLAATVGSMLAAYNAAKAASEASGAVALSDLRALGVASSALHTAAVQLEMAVSAIDPVPAAPAKS